MAVVKDPAGAKDALRVSEVADRLGVSARLVWRMVASGEIKAIRIGAGATRVRTCDLEAYLSTREVVGGAR